MDEAKQELSILGNWGTLTVSTFGNYLISEMIQEIHIIKNVPGKLNYLDFQKCKSVQKFASSV